MMDVSTERISTAEVMKLYGIKSRATLNQWFEEAGISSFRDGKNTFIYSFQLNALNELARNKRREIHSLIESEPESIERVIKPEQPQPIVSVSPSDIFAIATQFENINPVARWYAAHLILEQAALHQIVIPGNVLKILLNKKRLPAKIGGFRWGSFEIVSGNKSTWLVR